MEKERARRYQSASDFGADIDRYLHDEPIVARPPSKSYQLSKFAQRNKPLVGGIAAVLVVSVHSIVSTDFAVSVLDDDGNPTAEHTHWEGFLPRTAVGMMLEHETP